MLAQRLNDGKSAQERLVVIFSQRVRTYSVNTPLHVEFQKFTVPRSFHDYLTGAAASEGRVHPQLGFKLQLLSLLVSNSHPEMDGGKRRPDPSFLRPASYRISWSFTTSLTITTSSGDRETSSHAIRGMLPRSKQAVGQLAEPVRSVADRAAFKRKHGVHGEADRRSVGTEPRRVAYLAARMYTWVVLSAWLELLLPWLQQTSCRVKPKASR
ncbi:hypothetical protein EYF80_039207 [Liparis tanakae]|uniref:Uncharacterized protein n=1 Tax=Liparis tanakae TaxID=230148 RepID=A0A4Z2GAF7_9TELE|nr:hypothetical protein EYF80_039207 [Liparis tanakae]